MQTTELIEGVLLCIWIELVVGQVRVLVPRIFLRFLRFSFFRKDQQFKHCRISFFLWKCYCEILCSINRSVVRSFIPAFINSFVLFKPSQDIVQCPKN